MEQNKSYNIWLKRNRLVIRNKNKVIVFKSKTIMLNFDLNENKKALIDTNEISITQQEIIGPIIYNFIEYIKRIDIEIKLNNNKSFIIKNCKGYNFYEN